MTRSDSLSGALVTMAAGLLVVLALVMAVRAIMPDEVIPVRTWGGVTWAGDQCHVVEDLEVLVCRGEIG